MDVESLRESLHKHFLTVGLKTAGQFVFYDESLKGVDKSGIMILAIHTGSPERIQQIGQDAWDSIPKDIKAELKGLEIGFAVKQI